MNLLTKYIDLENNLLSYKDRSIVIITGTLRPVLLEKLLQQNSNAEVYLTAYNKKYLDLYSHYPKRIKFRLLDNKFPFYEYFIIQIDRNKAILGKTIGEVDWKTFIKDMMKEVKAASQSDQKIRTIEREIIFTQVSLSEQPNLQSNINQLIEKIKSANYFYYLDKIKENNNLQKTKKTALNLIKKYPQQDYFFRFTSALFSDNKQENHDYIIEKLQSPATPAPIETIYNQAFTEYFYKIFIKFQVAIKVSTTVLKRKIQTQDKEEIIRNYTIQYLKLLIEHTSLLLAQTNDPEEQKELKAQIEQYKKDLEQLENPNCPIKDKLSEKILLEQEQKILQKQVHAITKIIHPDIAPPEIKHEAKELATLLNKAYANKDKRIVNFIYQNVKSIKKDIKQYPQKVRKTLIQISLITQMLLENDTKSLKYFDLLEQYNTITSQETDEKINTLQQEIINLKQKISELKNLVEA